VRFSVPIRAVITASFAAAMTAGLLAAPVLAAPALAAGSQAAAHAGRSQARAVKPARLPLSAAQLQADQQRLDAAKRATSSLTGLARTATGAPLAGVCVTAYGPAGAKSAVTQSDGRFLISGLRPGSYQVRYRSCAGSSAQYLPEWYGDVLQRGDSRSVIVDGSTLAPVQALNPVTLYPADSNLADLPGAVVPQHGSDVGARDPFGRLATAPASPAAMMKSLVARYTPRGSVPASAGKNGRITGVVTSPNGKGLRGICVEAASASSTGAFVFVTAVTKTNGSYRTQRVPAGKYVMAFYAQCGNTGNWLFQIYKDIYNPLKTPTLVRVKAARTSRISVVMKEGGEISGSVTGPGGRKLSNICVYPLTNSPAGQLVFAAVSHRGVYHIRSVAPGSYQIGFASCGFSIWAPTLWPDTQNMNTAPSIQVHGTRHIGNIDEVMQPGGIIKGTVTAATSAATPLAGMCALVSENGGLFDTGTAATSVTGSYEISGLAAGSYTVQFFPGCNNNANYVGVTYPSNVSVAGGATTSGINGSLPVGATISGKVTSAATGKPLAGICVSVNSTDFENGGFLVTNRRGTYSIDQLPVDTYQVQFSGGCGNRGSYAPQAWNNTNVLEPQNIPVTAAGQNVTDISAAMQPGPVIAGTVTDSSGHGLTGICVLAGTASGVLFDEEQTVHGRYELPDLAPGGYEVIFAPGCGDNADLAEQVFKTPLSATSPATVSVSSGTLNGINAVMQGAGGISGVIRAKSGRAVEFSCVFLTGVSGSAKSVFGEAFIFGRTYELTGLPVGGYQVAFSPGCAGSNLETQWYKDKPSPAGATTVEIRSSHIDRHINSSLVAGGSIEGAVTSGGKPVHNMCVFAQNVAQVIESGFAITKTNGTYDVHGLNSGLYELEVSPCGRGSNTLAAEVLPQLVRVTAPKRTHGADADVPAGGAIKGTVAVGNGAAGACVEAFATNGNGFNSTNVALDGTFRLPNLPAGSYLVFIADPLCSFSEPGLAPQWYLGQLSSVTATRVMVSSGATTTLSSGITLADDGSITGTVKGAGGSPLRGACVAATAAGSAPVYSVTSSAGGYSISDLPAGQYQVEFSSGCGASGYLTQWWKDARTRQAAAFVTVSAGTTTTGIGARLRK
jgi:Carboxypeptidase regulatory-like domain